jgi:hypothetical protein
VTLPLLLVCVAVAVDRLHRPDSRHTFLDSLLGGGLFSHEPYYGDSDSSSEGAMPALAGGRPYMRWTVKLSRRSSKNIFLYDMGFRWVGYSINYIQ